MDLLVVSYGLEPGTYKIRIHLDQVWPPNESLRVPPIESSRFVPLDQPLETLDGEDIWIGFQVSGRGDFNTYVFTVVAGEDQVKLPR